MKTLFLEKRGCDFFKFDKINLLSDVGNYRVCTVDRIMGKDGRLYFLEITDANKYIYRKKHKVTGRELKKPVKELKKECCLHINSEFETQEGCFGNSKLDGMIWEMEISYTLEGILQAVNLISCEKYDKIEFINK